jgi:hypothetical protein
MGPLIFLTRDCTARYSRMRSLGFFQPVVVLIQDGLGLVDIQDIPGALVPGQGHEPVNIVAHHGGLGAHGRHHLELFQLGPHLVGRLPGHALFLELFLQLLDLALEVVLFAHLLLDGAHLLVEIVLALGLFHLALDPALDALLQLQDLYLARRSS